MRKDDAEKELEILHNTQVSAYFQCGVCDYERENRNHIDAEKYIMEVHYKSEHSDICQTYHLGTPGVSFSGWWEFRIPDEHAPTIRYIDEDSVTIVPWSVT